VPTRQAIRQELGKRLGSYASGTASGGSTTTIADDDNVSFAGNSSTPSPDLWEDAWVYPTSGTESGNTRRVTSTGFAPASGTLTVTPAWASGPSAGHTFEVYGHLQPEVMHDCINRTLRRIHHPHLFPLTLVTDGDMEASGTSSWTASNSSLAKNTTAANILSGGGAQALSVTTTSANGYGASAAIPVEEEAGYFVRASFRDVAAGTTPKLVVYDATNSAEINSETWVTGGNGAIEISFDTPDACRAINLRLQVVENSKVVYWDNVVLLENGRSIYPLPSSILNPEAEIIEVYHATGDERPTHQRVEIPWTDWEVLPDFVGANQFAIVLTGGTRNGPVWVHARRRYDELSADTGTTAADLDWVVSGALVESYTILKQSAPGHDVDFWKERLAEALTEFRGQNRKWIPRKGIRVRAGEYMKR
jgi:hypothetical protein